MIVDQSYVPWVGAHSYNMWAPDCNEKDGKYYFYFPANNRVGVATSDTPYGPFRVDNQPIQGANGIQNGVVAHLVDQIVPDVFGGLEQHLAALVILNQPPQGVAQLQLRFS